MVAAVACPRRSTAVDNPVIEPNAFSGKVMACGPSIATEDDGYDGTSPVSPGPIS
jgi:hypothetical protein